MMAWVRYGMWDRWRDLTRFRFACEMALSSYRTYVNGFPITSASPLVVTDPGGTAFKCDLTDFAAVLNDDQQLYRVLFPSYVALVEDLGRELVETLHAKGVERAAFAGLDPGLPIEQAAEHWITGTPVEAWGATILKLAGRGWSSFKGGRRGVVEAVTIRNLCAHGIPVYNQRALNRLAAASTAAAQKLPAAGQPIVLDRASFTRHVATLRGFARSMADGVANVT